MRTEVVQGRELSVVVERTPSGRFLAFSPDFPGCSATGPTREEALATLRRRAAALIGKEARR